MNWLKMKNQIWGLSPHKCSKNNLIAAKGVGF